jgi:hypothetical protein
MGGGTGFLSKSRWLRAVQLRWKGKRYAQATWLRLKGRKREDSLVVVSAYLRPVSATRTQADWQSDLAALSQDILHWQQNSNGGGAETSTHALVAKVQKQTRHHQSHNSRGD